MASPSWGCDGTGGAPKASKKRNGADRASEVTRVSIGA